MASKRKLQWRVLDWGAGAEGAPCSISYLDAHGRERTAREGDVVSDIPTSAIGRRGQEDIRSFILGVHIEEVGSEQDGGGESESEGRGEEGEEGEEVKA